MEEIQLYHAGPSDLELVQRVGNETYRPYFSHIWEEGGLEWYMEECFGNENLGRDLNNPTIRYLLPQTLEREIIGLLKVHPHRPMPDGPCDNAMYLEKIYLMPTYFKTGMGQRLLLLMDQYAHNLGRDGIWLQVMETGPVASYKKAGYSVWKEIDFMFTPLKQDLRSGLVMYKLFH
jgi:diamine N-acetyltransferase